MGSESRLDTDERYRNGVREAADTAQGITDREEAASRILQIADSLRKDDPRFLYREFFADVGAIEWDEFTKDLQEPTDG